MIRLANNFTYRYLKDDAKVFAVCKSNPCLEMTQAAQQIRFRKFYYSEPFLSIDTKTIRNALITFHSYDICKPWVQDMYNPIMDNPKVNDDVDISIEECDLSYLKVLSDMLSMPLMVIIESKDDNYEVFYYKQRVKDIDVRQYFK
jgi:hypothetical protein